MAMQMRGGAVVDLSASLLAQYGLSGATVQTSELLWTSEGILTQSQATLLAAVAEALGNVLQQYSDNPFENLTPTQIAEMSAHELATFSAGQIYNLTAADVAALSPSQVASLNLSGLTSAAVSGLSISDIEILTPVQMSKLDISGLSAQQLSVITPAQAAALSSSQVAGLSGSQFNSLSAAVIASLDVSDLYAGTIGSLSAGSLAALTDAQIASFGARQGSGIQYILPNLSVSQLQALQPAVFGAFGSVEFSGLSNTQIQALLPSQIAALSAGTVDGAFSAAQWNSLSSQQLQALNLADLSWQLGEFSESTVQAFTAAQISSLGTSAIVYLALQNNASGLQFLTTSQVQAFTSAQMQVVGGYLRLLTNSQIASLTAAQIQSLGDQIGLLTSAQLPALTASQIAALAPSQIASLAADQIAELTDTQIAALTPTEINALSSSQIGALSSTQLNALIPSQIAAFTAPQLQSLTATQLASLSNTQLNTLSGQQFSAFSASQVGALTDSQLSNLGATQLSGITAQQVSGLALSQQFDLQNAELSDGVLAINTGTQGLANPIGPLDVGGEMTVNDVVQQAQSDQVFLTEPLAAGEGSSVLGSTGNPSVPVVSSGVTQLSASQWQVGQTLYTYDSSGNLLSSQTTEANGSQLILNYEGGNFTGGQIQMSDGTLSNTEILAGGNSTIVLAQPGAISTQIQVVSIGSNPQVIAAGSELSGTAAAIGNVNGNSAAEGYILGEETESAGAGATAEASGVAGAAALSEMMPVIGVVAGLFDSYYSFNVMGADGAQVKVSDGLLSSSASITLPATATTSGYQETIDEDAIGDIDESVQITAPDGTITTETQNYNSSTNQTTISIGLGGTTQSMTVSGDQTDPMPTLQSLPTNLLASSSNTGSSAVGASGATDDAAGAGQFLSLAYAEAEGIGVSAGADAAFLQMGIDDGGIQAAMGLAASSASSLGDGLGGSSFGGGTNPFAIPEM